MRHFVTRLVTNSAYKRSLLIVAAFITLGVYASFEVHASASGVSGKTQKNGAGCTCHGQSNNTTVTITPPSGTIYAGQSYTFSVTVSNSGQAGAGINIAAGNGTLSPGSGLKLLNGELTHDPKVTSLPATWSFTYTAPSSPGTDNIYATGNAINNSGDNNGDQWNHATTYQVSVTALPTKAIALSKTTINLGNARVGASKSDTMSIHSTGDDALTINSTAMAFGTHFSRNPTSTNRTISVGQKEVNTITFSPTAKGSFTDTLIINSNATSTSDQRKTVIVTGTGTQGVFSGVTNLTFGDVDVNTSVRRGYVITNTGNDSLFLNTPTVSGTGFSIVTQPTRLSLAPNEKDSVVIQLTATAKQTYQGSLSITANGGVSVPSITLAGNGVAPSIQATTPFNTGGIRVGMTTQATVNFSNTGNDTLRVTSAQLTAGATSRFSIIGFSPVTVLAGQTGSIQVSYSPNDLVADTATLTLTSNALGQPTYDIKIYGTGTIPKMALTDGQDTLRFTGVRVGKTASLTFNIRNTGSDILALSKVSTSTPFAIEDKPTSIEPGTQGTVTVKFSPTATGTFIGMVVITGDDPNNASDTVYLKGVSVNSALNVPSNVEFGSTAPNVEVVQNLVLTNEGGAPVTIYSYKLAGAAVTSFRLIDTAAHTIAANGTATVKIGFKPASAGVFAATLNIAVDDNSAPIRTVALAGVGVQGQLQVNPTSIAFGIVDSGTTSPEQFITLKNVGSAPIAITNATFPCGDEFLLNVGTITSIAPGDSAKIGIRYAPKNRGVDNCTASISTSEGNNINITITGEGRGKDVGSVRANSPIADFKLKISPNPVAGTTMISLSMKRGADVQFDIYDMQGRVVHQISDRYLPIGEHSISLSTLGMSNGEYFIVATSEGMMAGEAKVIVQR